jgi:hypothetical protein
VFDIFDSISRVFLGVGRRNPGYFNSSSAPRIRSRLLPHHGADRSRLAAYVHICYCRHPELASHELLQQASTACRDCKPADIIGDLRYHIPRKPCCRAWHQSQNLGTGNVNPATGTFGRVAKPSFEYRVTPSIHWYMGGLVGGGLVGTGLHWVPRRANFETNVCSVVNPPFCGISRSWDRLGPARALKQISWRSLNYITAIHGTQEML